MKTFHSDISGKEFPVAERITGNSIRLSLMNLIQMDHPEFTPDKSLSVSELNTYREKYISEYLVKQVGELTELEKTVMTSLTDRTTLSDKIDDDEEQVYTFGQRIADKVATFGGSWTFIITFGVILFFWILLNVYWLGNKGFDPYPFILLNLILSCLAALQAPVIMMSQNRQEEKDRDRARKDYMINLKSELEIRTLHEKMDHLMIHQQQELLEIQKVQIEMMNDIMERIDKNRSNR
ncbi:DUF1003 domain-containing protein [Prolixibacter bellariivorans]|nr:DUF1003 domain-containing protein [Prolixibacter bellariivorans]